MKHAREARWVRSARGALIVVAVALAVSTPTSTSALPADDPFDDAFPALTTDLPALVDGPTPFNVLAGSEVCRMEFNGQVKTGPPWTFTYDPAAPQRGPSLVQVDGCEGWSDYVEVAARQAFEVGPRTASAERGPVRIEVRNNTAKPARVVVTDAKGKVVASRSAPVGRSTVKFRSTARDYARQLTVTAEGSGHRSTSPLTVTRGWNAYYGQGTFAPCSSIRWTYDDKGRPSRASKAAILRDVTGALSRLSRVTGLKFTRSTEAPAFGPNTIAVTWASLGRGGPLARGGGQLISMGSGGPASLGWIRLNRQHSSTSNDRTAGFGSRTSAGAPRGWTIVHEAMHVLGLDHTSDRRQLMYPVAMWQHALGGGDLAGLKHLYPKSSC